MDLFERIGRVLRSQLTHLQSAPQEPEQLLEEMTARMELELIDLRRGLAEAIAISKSTERQRLSQRSTAQRWYDRAQLALEKDNEALAREALDHWQAYHSHEQTLEKALGEQQAVIDRVRRDLRTLEQKYNTIKTQKSLYLARLKSAIAAQKLQEISDSLNRNSASSVFERMELKILELEAQGDLPSPSTDPLDQQFQQLEKQRQLEATLAQLKAQRQETPDPP